MKRTDDKYFLQQRIFSPWTSNGDKEGEKFMESIRDSYLHQHILGYT